MDLTGTLLAHYRVGPKIGEGGMGVVYRAHDTRLNRSVALKFIRPDVAARPDRVDRFRREAHLLASLNHQNIGAIYGLEEKQGLFFLVLELVEGETLAERIRRGPLPPRDAVHISRQIVRALTEAHEKGVIHRDLKPANVKLKPDGSVKVLDFGVAKALDDSNDGASAETREGTVIGTPGYMSPEQMLGETATRSTDIWAFGCVLLEMLSGERAFRGDTTSEVRAAVLRGDAHWSTLAPDTPVALQTLVKVCLEVDLRERLRHIGDARLLLDAATAPGSTGVGSGRVQAHRPRLRRLPAALTLAAIAVAAGFGVARFTTVPAASPAPLRLALAPPAGIGPVLAYGPTVAISPDGRTAAFVWESGTGSMLYLKRPEDLEAQPLAGTRGARSPFFSPAGEWIGFYDHDDRKLKRVSIGGGEPTVIANSAFLGGAVWAPDDAIVFAGTDGLFRVAGSGGDPVRITQSEACFEMWPEVLPSGHVMFSRLSSKGNFDEADIVAVDPRGGPPKLILGAAYYAKYVPTGHLIFVQGDSVLAAPFDATTLSVTGPAVTMVKGVWISSWTGYADFAISATGTLVYVAGGPHPTRATLATVDRAGAESPLIAEPRAYRTPRVSPDGRQVAVTLAEQQVDIWTYDMSGKVLNRVTDSPSWDAYPIWDPRMRWLAYSSTRDGVAAIYRQDLQTNAVEKLVTMATPVYPTSWSGGLLAFEEENPTTGLDVWVYSLESKTSRVFLRTPFNESKGEFSPDARFIAYQSTEAGQQTEIYLRPYPEANPRRQVSTNGGTSPRWGSRGTELFYRVGSKVMAVPVKFTPDVQVGHPREVVAGPYGGYDAGPHGQAFTMVAEMSPGDPPTRINLVMHWFDELTRTVAPR